MNRLLLRFTVLFFLVVYLSSCSKDKGYSYIPEDATFVMTANFKNLALDALSLKNLLSQSADSGRDTEVEKKFQNTGIDFLGSGFLFRTEENRGRNQIFAVLPLDNEEDFRGFLKGLDSNLTASQAFGMDWLSGEDFLIGMNGEIAVGLLGEPGRDTESMRQYLSSLASLPEDKQLIHKNPRLKALKERGSDTGFWLNAGRTFDISGLPMAGALKPGGGELFAAIDFADGEISVSGEGFNEDPDMKAINACFSQNLDDGFLASLPMEKPAGVLAWRMDLGKLLASMEKTTLGEGLQANITESGFRKEDVFGALTGQMALAIAGTPSEGNFMPGLYLSAEIGNAEKLRRVLEGLALAGLLTPAGSNTWEAGFPGLASFRVKAGDKTLSISNTAEESRESFRVSGDREKGNFLLVADFRRLGSGLPPDEIQEGVKTFSEYWTRLTGWGRLENETTMSFGIQITSAFPDENALLTLGKSAAILREKTKEKPEPETPFLPGGEPTVTDSTGSGDWQVQ